MDILDILLDILLKSPQPLMGLFFSFESETVLPPHTDLELLMQNFDNGFCYDKTSWL